MSTDTSSATLRSRDSLVTVLEATGMSERQLARTAGLSHSTVNHLFTGRRTSCGPGTARSIERALGCKPGTLFTGAATGPAADSVTELPLPKLTAEAVTRLLDVDGETVREEFTPERFDDLEIVHVERLVNHAVEAGLLPKGTLIWATADGDGAVDGALITWTGPDNRRYASHHQDYGDLTTDRNAVGDALAYAVLDAVRLTVEQECMPAAARPAAPARYAATDDPALPLRPITDGA